MKYTSLLIFLFILPLQMSAQLEEVRFEDCNYRSNIKSVQFHLEGLLLTQPIIELGSNGRLVLSFDDLDADVKNYSYEMVQCDADWTPSQLSYFEYNTGFQEGYFQEYNFSFNTLIPYTHYELALPNRDMQWTKSGNYLLVVYDYDDDRIPVITRRFVVVEPVVNIMGKFQFPGDVQKNKTHQELDFAVDHKGVELRNPRLSVTATVLQNGRWDNAVTDIPPFFVRNNELLDFDYQDRIVFEAGKEWRFLDLRSLRNPSSEIGTMDRFDDGLYATLLKEDLRNNQPYLNITDLNGGFVIENRDELNPALASDYVHVLFSLATDYPYADADVYLFGKISNFKIKEDYKMAYNPQYNAYVGKTLLKQGFYNYSYAVVSGDGKQIDFTQTEGNWFETENEYTVLIYYKPIGERYTRVIGVQTFSTRP